MRAKEFVTELRDRMFQYIKSIVPAWPDYVVKDWLYAARGKGNTSNDGIPIKDDILELLADSGVSPATKWQLIPNIKFTMDMFEPSTQQKLIGRAGGKSDLGMGVPRDAERHATQAQLAKQQGGVSREPVILIKTAQGYRLVEGWHRTIQHFDKYPNGYTGPAYVAVAQGPTTVAEGSRQHLDFDEIYGKYLKVTDNDGDPNKEGFSLVTPLNGASWNWQERPEFKKIVKQNLNRPGWLGDHKYQQIIDAMAGNKFDPVKHLATENFADGKVKGRSRPGRVKRAGASCKGSVTSLRKRAKNSSGERAKMYHWCANMKSGKQK